MDSKLFTSLLKEMSELHPDATLKDVSDYFEMCDKVATFNEEAALYLRYHAWREHIEFSFDAVLSRCFRFDLSKQGNNYWQQVNQELQNVA